MTLARLICLMILMAQPALAHGNLPGGGGFYSGALHPLIALEHAMVLFAGGLSLGRDGIRRPLWALAAGLGIGLWWGVPIAGLTIMLLVLALVFGLVLALRVRWPVWLGIVLCLAVGLAVGLDTDLPTLNFKMAALGAGVAVFLITMNAFALASVLAGSKAEIALRVGGAWILAASLMVLAFELTGLS